MEFVTIHDLSRELNVPARVIRYRLISLIADGKLKEADDFRRDDFKDDQHFVWKIHPLRFMQESRLQPATESLTMGSKPVDHALPTVNQTENRPDDTSAKPAETVANSDNHIANKIGNNTGDSTLAREMIDLLKEQIRVKDGQLKDQGEQLKETHELNMKLTGTMLQQGQEIKNLLRLTGGQTGPSSVVNQQESVPDEPATVAA